MKHEQGDGDTGAASRTFRRSLVPCCALPLAAPRAPEAALPAMLPAAVIGWWMSANNDCVRQLELQYLRAGASVRWTDDRFEARFRPHGQVGGILLYNGTDLEVLAGGRWVHTAYLCEFSPGADETNITVAAVGTAPGR